MAGGYSVTISAVDKASGAFDSANKAVERLNKRIALARAPFDQLSQNFQKFTKVTGLERIATGFRDVARAGTDTFRSVLRVLEPMAAITGAASVAGVYRLATAWGQFGSQLGLQASRAGQSADGLQALQGAARLAFVPVETLTTGMTALNDNMRNAAFGGAPQFISALNALGISYDELKKKTPTEAFGILADAINKHPEPADRAMLVNALGLGEGMLPLIAKGSKGIRELSAEARKLSRQQGSEGVKSADQFRQAQVRLALASEGLANALGEKIAPVLTPLLNDFATWISTSPEVNSGLTAIGEAARNFAVWLKAIDWHSVGENVKLIGQEINSVVTWLGGWQSAGEDIILFFAGRFLTQMLAPFASIAAALLAVPIKAALAAKEANIELAKIRPAGAALSGPSFMRALLGPLGIALDTLTGDGSVAQPGDMEKAHPWLQSLNEFFNGTADRPSFFNGGLGRMFGFGRSAGGDSGGTSSIPPGVARDNARAMGAEFSHAGFTQEGAAAMLGASMGESGNNPDPAHNNEGRGAFQWSPERQAAIAAHFRKAVTDMTAAEQARAAIWEIDTRPEFAALKSGLRSSHDLAGLNSGVTATFEAPADIPGQTDARMPMARGALRQLQIDQANAPSGDPVSAPAPNSVAGAPGANGRVDMNVKVQGAAQVTTTSSGGVNVETRNVARDGW